MKLPEVDENERVAILGWVNMRATYYRNPGNTRG